MTNDFAIITDNYDPEILAALPPWIGACVQRLARTINRLDLMAFSEKRVTVKAQIYARRRGQVEALHSILSSVCGSAPLCDWDGTGTNYAYGPLFDSWKNKKGE